MMTEEEKKKAEETAAAEAEAKAKEKEQADADFEAEIAELSDEDKEVKRAERDALNTDNQPDYKAIAQQEREKREKAEKDSADKAFKLRELKRKKDDDGEDPPDNTDDKPVTGRELQRILDENTQKTERRFMGSRIKEIAKSLADSEEEAEAIVEIHANRTFPPGLSIEEQLEEAHAIANRKRLVSTNSELKRALKSKGTVSRDSAGTHRDATPGVTPKIAPDLEASLKRQQFAFDATSKLWKKKLPSGKYLVKDVRTKPIKTYVIG